MRYGEGMGLYSWYTISNRQSQDLNPGTYDVCDLMSKKLEVVKDNA